MQEEPDHYYVLDRLYITYDSPAATLNAPHAFKYFSIHGVLSYQPYFDDFGPMSLDNVYIFCSIVEDQLARNPDKLLALKTYPDRRSISNAVFLVGSYAIMMHEMEPCEVERRLTPLRHRLVPFRDISPGKQNFDLHVKDCWDGLWKAKSLGWVDFRNQLFDLDEYSHYASPINGFVHEMVPGKFIAMRCPKEMEEDWNDVRDGAGRILHREFSPQHFVETLQNFGVQVR